MPVNDDFYDNFAAGSMYVDRIVRTNDGKYEIVTARKLEPEDDDDYHRGERSLWLDRQQKTYEQAYEVDQKASDDAKQPDNAEDVDLHIDQPESEQKPRLQSKNKRSKKKKKKPVSQPAAVPVKFEDEFLEKAIQEANQQRSQLEAKVQSSESVVKYFVKLVPMYERISKLAYSILKTKASGRNGPYKQLAESLASAKLYEGQNIPTDATLKSIDDPLLIRLLHFDKSFIDFIEQSASVTMLLSKVNQKLEPDAFQDQVKSLSEAIWVATSEFNQISFPILNEAATEALTGTTDLEHFSQLARKALRFEKSVTETMVVLQSLVSLVDHQLLQTYVSGPLAQLVGRVSVAVPIFEHMATYMYQYGKLKDSTVSISLAQAQGYALMLRLNVGFGGVLTDLQELVYYLTSEDVQPNDEHWNVQDQMFWFAEIMVNLAELLQYNMKKNIEYLMRHNFKIYQKQALQEVRQQFDMLTSFGEDVTQMHELKVQKPQPLQKPMPKSSKQ